MTDSVRMGQRGKMMTRLIDADSAAKEISRFVGYLDDDTILRLQIALKRLPTIDAVPVVRCKDCKFFREHLSMNCVYHISAVGENWFCSQGRKMTE